MKANGLNIDDVMNIKIKESKEMPINGNDLDHHYAIINRRYLSDTKGELFNQTMDLIYDALMDDDFSSFVKEWNDALVNEVFKHYQEDKKSN